MKPPYAIGSVPSLSGHAIAYRWRSLPRIRQHRASKPQGSSERVLPWQITMSERVLPWQITMDQLIFASLSQTHYWYEVGMLKVPAVRDKRKELGSSLNTCQGYDIQMLLIHRLSYGPALTRNTEERASVCQSD